MNGPILPLHAPKFSTPAEVAVWRLLRPRLRPEDAVRKPVRDAFLTLVEEITVAGENVSKARVAAVQCGLASALPGALRAATKAAATPGDDDFDDDLQGPEEAPSANPEPASPAPVPDERN